MSGARSRKGPAERKAGDERWAQLLSVSARIFAENGYASTSLQDIADGVGMLKGSLYYYIDSKEDLLFEVIQSVYRKGLANLLNLAAGEASAMDRLRRVIVGHVVHLVAHLTETTVFLHEFKQLSLARRSELNTKEYDEVVRALVEEGVHDGSIRADADLEVTTMAVLGIANWVYRWYDGTQTRTPEQIGTELAEILTTGLEAWVPEVGSGGATPQPSAPEETEPR